MNQVNQSKPLVFYILSIILIAGVTYIGFQFGSGLGAFIGFFCSAIIVYYALSIEEDEPNS